MGNWLPGWSSGGSLGVPPMPVQKLEKSVQVNLELDEKCLSQTEVSSVPSQKLEEYIQANLKPDEESLKHID